MTTVAILQPGYLPWLGFFDQIRRADVFVYYDDVPFDKHGWRNRNRVKSPNGPLWLTVPVCHKGLGQPAIREVAIDHHRPWPRKHVATLRQLYARAPHREPHLSQLAALLDQPWENLAELDMAVAALLCRWLGLTPPLYRASELGIAGGQSQRLVNLCRHFNASHYLTGDAARDYLDTALFAAHGIAVVWQEYRHPVYEQLHGPFLSHLSAVDLIFNHGAAGREIFMGQGA